MPKKLLRDISLDDIDTYGDTVVVDIPDDCSSFRIIKEKDIEWYKKKVKELTLELKLTKIAAKMANSKLEDIIANLHKEVSDLIDQMDRC